MFPRLRDWLDHRTGYRRLIEVLLIEHIPGGAKWRYVWGSCLLFVFALQLITGVLLMTSYSPGDSTAWSSVYFIQYEMDFGWLIRGLHHFGSQAMVVLLGIHMLQVVIAGAHLPPREVNWWLGLALLAAVLGLSLTGYLLPWDQKGYWATQVATNIAGNLPILGPWLQKIIVGGPDYGHHTLTRFYTLHVGVLPPLVILLIIAHLTVFRRHEVTTPKNAPGQGWFWPEQAFRDMLVSMVIFGILLSLVLWGHGHKIETPVKSDPSTSATDSAPTSEPSLYERWAHAGRDGRGANLDAPADPARPYPPRPEWYFLFLFQLLKYFEGENEIIGTVIIPQGVGLLLALLPLLGYGPMRKFGHGFGILVIVGVLSGAAALTCLAIADDMVYPLARALLVRIATGAIPSIAVVFLVQLGILALLGPGRLRTTVSVAGAVILTGLFAGTSALAYRATQSDHKYAEHQRASRGSEFAETDIPGPVAKWVEKEMIAEEKKSRPNAEKFRNELVTADQFGARAVQLASAGIPADGAIYLLRRDPLTEGKRLFGQHCASCHTHGADFQNEKASASDLAAFGSAEWVRGMLRNPGSPHYLGRTKLKSGEMTSWVRRTRDKERKKGKEAELDQQFDTIAQWLSSHPRREIPKDNDTSSFAQGYRQFADKCSECHSYKPAAGEEASKGPDFSGYGDADWVRVMIMSPDHPLRYGDKNEMPAFRDLEGPGAEVTRLDIGERNGKTKFVHLGDIDRELIIRWLVKDYRVVFGGELMAPPPER